MTHKALKVLFKRSEADRMALEKDQRFNEFLFLAGDLIGWVYADDIFHVLYEQQGWTKDIKSWGMEMKYIIIFLAIYPLFDIEGSYYCESEQRLTTLHVRFCS
eukprot:TRINITY_DN3199_c0_g2_i3.p3 TRINITY_DN3199_c0_g2~~TRINITY_DN3199_c0_g2_i3.p3  ORF type:complete len:103 (-),score=7.24 TRINITY_DN3199_c0_g2_i3:439-747(-)